MKLNFLKGQTLIELVLAMGLAALIFPTLLAGFMNSREGKIQQGMRVQAVALLKETESAVRAVRNNDWTTFAVNGTYHIATFNNKWTLNSGTQTTNGLTQQIDINNVSRDTNGAIVTSGGTIDPSTKKITITISWTKPQTSNVVSTMYLTRTSNSTDLDSSFSQFSNGVKSSTIVATTSGSVTDGQVQLGAGGGGGDWCEPSFLIATVDLPKSGVANAVAAIAGPASNGSTIFAGTGENASGISFAKVDIPGNPPTASIPATFDGYKTNSVFGENNYAYMTTDNNSKEVAIINLNQYSDSPANSKYNEVGAINLPGSINGTSIYVTNNKAYITSSDKKFYVYNLSADRSIATPSGSLTLDGVGKKVLVAGDYAYIATDSTTYQLEIVKLSDLSVARLTLSTGQSGVDVYVNTFNSNPDRVYILTSQSANHNEFYVVNVSNKANPKTTDDLGNELGKYDTSGMTTTGLTVVTGNRAIIVGTGGTYQYEVVNLDLIDNSGTKGNCGHLTYATGIRGVASVLQGSGFAYSYVITGDASSELKIILGGAGGSYTSSGNFESAIYDAGYSVAYNRFVANITLPSFASISAQVAVAPPGGSGCSNATYQYLGPGGNPNSFFTAVGASISGAIPFGNYQNNTYQNPARCFRYKLWLSSSDITQTPVVYDVGWNHSL